MVLQIKGEMDEIIHISQARKMGLRRTCLKPNKGLPNWQARSKVTSVVTIATTMKNFKKDTRSNYKLLPPVYIDNIESVMARLSTCSGAKLKNKIN